MNWYGHHIGDWLKKTSDLSLVQEGVYRRLVDWYYTHEKALPLSLKEVGKIARASTMREREAVQFVVHRYFNLVEDGWHHERIDEEVARYKQGEPIRLQKKVHAMHRQQRSRERRVAIFSALRELGIVPAFNTPMAELQQLMQEHGVTLPVTRDERVTEQYKPQPTTREPMLSSESTVTPKGATGTLAGNACKAMRKAGLLQSNPSHPGLLRLLDGGATVEELALCAAEAAARGKGFAWVLATVEGRRNDADAKGPLRPLEGRQSAKRAEAEAWAPLLAANASTGSP